MRLAPGFDRDENETLFGAIRRMQYGLAAATLAVLAASALKFLV